VALAQPDFPKSLFPEEGWLELDRTENIFREELSKKKLMIRDGYIEKPMDPGLGLDIDEDLIRRYRVG
jgi:L-alanine-DL-glutamate epimerase-like enolase superfamily enzyme